MNGRLEIKSIPGLGWKMHIKSEFLLEMAESAPLHYRPFSKKMSGKIRMIDRPDAEMKWIQTRIHRLILPCVPVGSVHGAVTGRSPKTNAQKHLGKKCVIRIDIRDFFPSVTNDMVYRVLRSDLGCSPGVSGLLTKLTTYRGHLPLGSPVSADLANLVLCSSDEIVVALCKSAGITYTRYIDDLVLSGESPRTLIQPVVACLRAAGFSVSREKLVVQPRSRLQVVTGYSVNSAKRPGIPNGKEAAVRAGIHQLDVGDSHELLSRISSLEGRIRFIEAASDGAGRRLWALLESKLNTLLEYSARYPEELKVELRERQATATSARSSARRRPRAAPSR